MRRIHYMPDGTPALDVARANGIRQATFYTRVCRDGWSIEEAATRPTRAYHRTWKA